MLFGSHLSFPKVKQLVLRKACPATLLRKRIHNLYSLKPIKNKSKPSSFNYSVPASLGLSALGNLAATLLISSKSSSLEIIPLRSRRFVNASSWITSDINSSLRSTVCFGSSFSAMSAFYSLSMVYIVCKVHIQPESPLLCCERLLCNFCSYSTCKMAYEISWTWRSRGKQCPDYQLMVSDS